MTGLFTGLDYYAGKTACEDSWASWPSITKNKAHLAKIPNINVNSVAAAVCGARECFLGLDDIDTPGVYSWYDGTPVYHGLNGAGGYPAEPGIFSSWFAGQPTDADRVVVIDGNQAKWHADYGAYMTLNHICQIHQECLDSSGCAGNQICIDHACITVSNGCPPGWTSDGSGGSCVKPFDLGMNYTEAKAYCPGTYYWPSKWPNGTNAAHLAKITMCEVDTHCPASMRCSPDNRCVGCVNSGDCTSNLICIDNACTAVNDGCPPGWTSDLKGGSCIKRVIDYIMTYTEAKAYCPGTYYWPSGWPNGTNTAHLVKIPDADAEHQLRARVCSDTFKCILGLDDIDTPGVYSWYDGTPVYHGVNGNGGYPEPGIYNKFPTGEPSMSPLNFYIDKRSDFWEIIQDGYTTFAVCQIYQVCDIDLHCPAGLICNTPANRCVECLLDDDCPGDKVCVSNTCKDIPCDVTDDCPESVQLCISNICTSVIDGCPLGWLPDTGSGCLKASDSTANFDDSELACNTTEWPSYHPGSNIGHLAKITSAAMNDVAWLAMSSYSPFQSWIGLFGVTAALHVWRDNEVATYFNWETVAGTGCVMMFQPNGKWAAGGCLFDGAGRVCQIKQFCEKDANCPSGTPRCFKNEFKCVECVVDGHCSGGNLCINNTCVECKDEYCSGGKVCSSLSGCVECVIGDGDTFRGCSNGDEPFCLPLEAYAPDLPAFQNDTGVCLGCLDTGALLDTDTGCSEGSPLCVVTHEFVIGDGGVINPVVAYSMCYTCQDTETGSTADLGCSPTQPYCVFGRDETGYGHGCSEYPNPACFFSSEDIAPDTDITCPTDIAVEARIELALENCTATSMNLTSIAISMASAMNLSACALELSLVHNQEKRHLLGNTSNFTLLLLVFVSDEAQGSAILYSTIELALVLALLEDHVGQIAAIRATVAMVVLSSVTSDPHFVTSDGSKFDFNGVAGQSYCIVTDARLQVNARLMGTAKSPVDVNAPSGRPDSRTWMDQVAILYGSDQVLVEAASPPGTPFAASFGTIRVNGAAI
eukprot:jgi/Mesvir1/12099/Mv00369-RA.1